MFDCCLYVSVKFEAMADVKTAHHILLFGCEGGPYSDRPVW